MISRAMNWTRIAAGLAILGGLSACGSASQDGPGIGTAIRGAAAELGPRSSGRAAAPAAAPDPQAQAAEALRVNPGPLILVGLESQGRTQVLAMTGENQGKRTYMTESMEGLILRDGMVLGTRGLGNDLSVAEPGTEPLIRARRAGTAPRLMRFWGGDGQEHTQAFTCTVEPGPERVTETCSAGQARFENRYIVGPGGALSVSRQWLGSGLGYVTVQVLRP